MGILPWKRKNNSKCTGYSVNPFIFPCVFYIYRFSKGNNKDCKGTFTYKDRSGSTVKRRNYAYREKRN